MIINILIGWNIILTFLLVLIVAFNSERQARIDKIEMDIEKDKVYDIIVEEPTIYACMPSSYYNYKQRIVTMKEAIACLYQKCNFHLSYIPEKTETVSEDVSIK